MQRKILRDVLVLSVVCISIVHSYCVPQRRLTARRCKNPAVVRDFDLSQFTGKWFQLFTSGTSTHSLSNRCATSNVTLLADGTLSMLNCHLPEGKDKAQCQRVIADRRVGGKKGQLQVQFEMHGEVVPYNVAAVLGDAESGYEAAAIYECGEDEGVLRDGIVVLAREKERAEVALDGLMEVMRCAGYDVGGVRFYVSGHSECAYFEDGVGEIVDEFL